MKKNNLTKDEMLVLISDIFNKEIGKAALNELVDETILYEVCELFKIIFSELGHRKTEYFLKFNPNVRKMFTKYPAVTINGRLKGTQDPVEVQVKPYHLLRVGDTYEDLFGMIDNNLRNIVFTDISQLKSYISKSNAIYGSKGTFALLKEVRDEKEQLSVMELIDYASGAQIRRKDISSAKTSGIHPDSETFFSEFVLLTPGKVLE